MAGLTKAQARSLIQQFIDDPSAKLWSAANLDLMLGLTLDELWGDVLDHAPFYASQQDENVVVTAPGYVNVASGGALSKRLYRLQKVVRGNIVYSPGRPQELTVVNSAWLSGDYYTHTRQGDQLWLIPLNAADDVTIRYSFRPARSDSLADGDTISWPDGYELAYCWETAARMMNKGERNPGEILDKRAERSLYRMKAAIARREIGPMGMTFYDSPEDWGMVDDSAYR